MIDAYLVDIELDVGLEGFFFSAVSWRGRRGLRGELDCAMIILDWVRDRIKSPDHTLVIIYCALGEFTMAERSWASSELRTKCLLRMQTGRATRDHPHLATCDFNNTMQ